MAEHCSVLLTEQSLFYYQANFQEFPLNLDGFNYFLNISRTLSSGQSLLITMCSKEPDYDFCNGQLTKYNDIDSGFFRLRFYFTNPTTGEVIFMNSIPVIQDNCFIHIAV